MEQGRTTVQHWIRFITGGAINTGFTYALYFLLQGFIYYQIAYAIAYAAGIVFSYWFNACFVFKVPLTWRGLFAYPIVYAVQYCLSAGLLGFFIEFIHIPRQVGPLLVLVLMIPFTFFMSRWVLRAR